MSEGKGLTAPLIGRAPDSLSPNFIRKKPCYVVFINSIRAGSSAPQQYHGVTNMILGCLCLVLACHFSTAVRPISACCAISWDLFLVVVIWQRRYKACWPRLILWHIFNDKDNNGLTGSSGLGFVWLIQIVIKLSYLHQVQNGMRKDLMNPMGQTRTCWIADDN